MGLCWTVQVWDAHHIKFFCTEHTLSYRGKKGGFEWKHSFVYLTQSRISTWKCQYLHYASHATKHIFSLISVTQEMEMIYSTMLDELVLNHLHAGKGEALLLGPGLTSYCIPHLFSALVSVKRRPVEKLSHCRCALSPGTPFRPSLINTA